MVSGLVDDRFAESVGPSTYEIVRDLFPLCRSITGDGVRATLARVAREIPLAIHEVPSGTAAFDWTVPREWNVRDAYVADATGRRVIDFRASNLHLVSYSAPVRTQLSLEELQPHLHSLPEQPELVPYRTSYYREDWGFCASQRQRDSLQPGSYEVCVDSTLADGSLTYGECLLPGASPDEVLVSTHVCHPSLANDNLSGIAVATAVARLVADSDRRLTYRFVFVPGTLGSLVWLSRNEEILARVRHGLVLTGLGGPGNLVWKRTRHGQRQIDAAGEHVVGTHGGRVIDFSPWGYDERQYNSPGFDLPVGRLTRTPHGEYPEYHTSGDDLDLVSPDAMAESVAAVLEIVDILENDGVPMNLSPKGEPQLGRRGLYPSVGGRHAEESVMAMLWLLSLADGQHTLLDVARRSGLPFALLRRTQGRLIASSLIGRPDHC